MMTCISLFFSRMNIFTDSLPDFETQVYNPPDVLEEDLVYDDSPLYQNQMMDPKLNDLDSNDNSNSQEVDFFKQFVIFG